MISSAGAVYMQTLVKRHAGRIRGVHSCFDRVLIVGTLADIGHAVSFTRELNRRGVRLFDFAESPEPLRDQIRDNAERLAKENGITMEIIRRIAPFRKDDRVKEIVAERGTHPGHRSAGTHNPSIPGCRGVQHGHAVLRLLSLCMLLLLQPIIQSAQ